MDNRYDLLPSYYYKDSEDGKLTKSVGKPLRDYKIYGESFQRQLPTPETPVAIEEVGEKYECLVDETGENLFSVVDGTNTVNGIVFTGKSGTVTCSYESGVGFGVVSAKNFTALSNYISYATISESCSFFLKAGTYEFSYDREGSTAFNVVLVVGDIGTSAMSGETKALNYGDGSIISVTEDTYCMPVYAGDTSSASSATFTNISLKKKVAEYKYKVPVKSYGKNIADPIQIREFVERMNAVGTHYTSATYVTIFTDENGREILKFHAASAVGHPDATELRTLFKGIFKPNTQYTISFDYYRNNTSQAMNMGVLYTDGTTANFGGCGGVKNQVYNYKWTTAAGKTIDSIRLVQHGETNFIYLDTFQIEEGTTKTDYEKCIGTRYIYLNEPLRKVLEPPTSYTNIVDIDYILENNPTSTTSLKRETFQDRDCISWSMGSRAAALRIMQGKFKENTAYTIKMSVASSIDGGSIDIVYTDGHYHRVEFSAHAPEFTANTFRDIIVLTDVYRTVDYIRGHYSADQWEYIDINKFVIIEGICDCPYIPAGEDACEIPVYSNSRNLANPLLTYNFVSNILYAPNGFNSATRICIDKNGQRILCNYAGAAYNTQNYNERAKIFKGIFKENTQYTISFDYCIPGSSDDINMGFHYPDGNYNVFRAPTGIDRTQIHHFTLTSQAGKTIDSVRLFYTSGTSRIYIDTLQIEEGTVETEYVPYVLKKIDVKNPYSSDSEKQLKIDCTADNLDYKDKKFKHRSEKVYFTGDEDWQFSGEFNGTNVFYLDNAVPSTPVFPNMVIGNYFTPKERIQTTDWKHGEMRFQYSSPNSTDMVTAKRLYVANSDCSTHEEFKAWLADLNNNGNPAYIVYALETPIEEPITLPQIPTQKGDCNIIVQTNTKPSKTEYQYYRGGK